MIHSTRLNPEKRIYCTGPSMRPTLRAGDLLGVRPYMVRKPALGDVVTFFSPDKKCSITHRVISVRNGRLRTRGDNNRFIDENILNSDTIVGRVLYLERNGKKQKVLNGRTGYTYSLLVRALRTTFSQIRPILRIFYRLLADTRIPQIACRWFKKPKVISFDGAHGTELVLTLGGRPIGYLHPNHENWIIRPPYRLLIDERKLPQKNELN
ncbi:putative signal peptidase I [delta proteobacterium NaphS2]|nr:putative signal peptidase I [delta proteobacterium NaphS2]